MPTPRLPSDGGPASGAVSAPGESPAAVAGVAATGSGGRALAGIVARVRDATGGDDALRSGAAGPAPTGGPVVPGWAHTHDAAGPVPLRASAWRHGRLEHLSDPDAIGTAVAEPDTLIWIDLAHDDTVLLGTLAQQLGLHPLIVEDIHEQNQRAKVEVTGDVLHLVMFALDYDGELQPSEIDFVLGERFLLTAHDPGWDPHAILHFHMGPDPYLAGGPDYVLWALVDALVDGYFPVFDSIGDALDDLQDEVIGRPTRGLIERLFRLKRDLVQIRHAVNPQREIFNQLTNRELRLVRPERIVYFRDVYDHLIRLTDELDTYRDMVGTTLDAYLTTVNNDLSEVMKRLTAVTVVLAGVGALAGVFGMSEAGPALHGGELIGFWVVVALILALGAAATLYFRRTGWL
jgi:magnesium transporter